MRVAALDSVSAGGEAMNVTDQVHQDWQQAAARLTKPIGLFVAGYDVIGEDISQPLADNYLPLLEINSVPGFKVHCYPTAGGDPIDLAGMLLDAVFDIAKTD